MCYITCVYHQSPPTPCFHGRRWVGKTARDTPIKCFLYSTPVGERGHHRCGGSKALLGPDVHTWYPPTPVAERACALCTCKPYTQHHLLMWAGKHKLYTPQTLLLGGSVCPIHYPMYVRSTTHSPHSPFLLLSISMIIILNLTYFFKYLLVYVLPFMYSNEVFSGYQCSHNRN